MRQKQIRGFTLLEMMAVVGIFALLFALAIPGFVTYMHRLEASSGCQRLYTDLKKEQIRAIALSETTGIKIHADGVTYHPFEGGTALGTRDLSPLNPGISISSPGATIQFSRGGWVDGSSTTVPPSTDGSETFFPIAVSVREGSYQAWVYQDGRIIRK